MARANATRPFMGRVVLTMCLEFTMEPLEKLVLSRKCGFATFLDPRGGRPPRGGGLGVLSRAGLEIDWGGL